MVELLFEECKHSSCVLWWPWKHFLNLAVNSDFTENAEFHTEARSRENCEVVQNHDDEGAPEQRVHPGEWNLAVDQYAAVVYM